MQTLEEQLNVVNTEVQRIELQVEAYDKVAWTTKWISNILAFIAVSLFTWGLGYLLRSVLSEIFGLIVFYYFFYILSIGWLSDRLQSYLYRRLLRFEKLDPDIHKDLKNQRSLYLTKRLDLEKEIHEVEESRARAEKVRREHSLVKELESFIESLGNFTPSQSELVKAGFQTENRKLYDEYISIRSAGFVLHNNLFYKNRFDTISKQISRIFDVTVDTVEDKSFKEGRSMKASDSRGTSIFSPKLIQKAPLIVPNVDKQDGGSLNALPTKPSVVNTAINNEILEVFEEPTDVILSNFIKRNIQSEVSNPLAIIARPSIKISQEEYLERNRNNQDLGHKGELFILENERKKLLRHNKPDLAEKVQHISLEIGDSIGYDILSFDEAGNKIFIEVKTTKQEASSAFYLSDNELSTLRGLENYFIYRVFDFNEDTGRGKFHVIDCKNQLNNNYKMEAVSYRISPNTSQRL